MRRPHRTIETFDISLMAVVTKAMGAFLVLMLLLLPYYTPEPREADAEELLRQLRKLSVELDTISRQLGDPNRGADQLRKDLGKISVDATLRTEVIAKLEGLIHKTFSEIKRLETEVAQLKSEVKRLEDQVAALQSEVNTLEAENAQLRAEIDALLRKIAELEEQIRKLRQQAPEERRLRIVTASFSADRCNDVDVGGLIIKVGAESEFTWRKDKTKIRPNQVLNVDFQSEGSLPTTAKRDTNLPDSETFRSYKPRRSAGILVKSNVGVGEHVIALIKKDPKRRWTFEGRTWRMLRTSKRSCLINLSAASQLGDLDNWTSHNALQVLMQATTVAGIVAAFTSDNKGIRFRTPTNSEHQWFAELLASNLKQQEEIPEYKKELEEEERKRREAEERRRKEAEEKRRRDAEIEAKQREERNRRFEQLTRDRLKKNKALTPKEAARQIGLERQIERLELMLSRVPGQRAKERIEEQLNRARSALERMQKKKPPVDDTEEKQNPDQTNSNRAPKQTGPDRRSK